MKSTRKGYHTGVSLRRDEGSEQTFPGFGNEETIIRLKTWISLGEI